jgi:hypothetical protein
MKAGTIIQLPDGRIGTVVYNSLDGVGIKWGKHNITQEDIFGHGGLFASERELIPPDYDFFPDAMLREPYPYADLPCVGCEYEIINIER